MSQWTKRRGAGICRGFMIGLVIALMVWLFFMTNIFDVWFEGIPLSWEAFLNMDFWFYLGVMIFIIALVSLFIRSTINWGGS